MNATQPVRGTEQVVERPRSLIREVVLGLVVCLVFFTLIEGSLRLVGWPAADAIADPFVGFSSIKPLFRVEDGVASTVPERLRYFNKVSFTPQKPPGTFRIFCFGGSTTYGRPFDGRTSFSRWLQDLLGALEPDTRFEVINAGGISYASYRIVPLVREALQFQPDLVILYTGHNEFLERRTYAGMFAQGSGLITIRSLVENLYIYRALKRIIEPLLHAKTSRHGSPEGKARDAENAIDRSRESPKGSTKSTLKDEVTAILDRSAGLDLYYRDEEFSRGVVRHFAHNLETMIRVCKDAGVPVIVVEPASNLKDFSPFKSEHRNTLTAGQRSELDRKIEEAAGLVKGGKYGDALTVLDGVIEKDPLYAETYYWKGRALLGGRDYAQARENFVKAQDLDVCPLRCITQLQQQIARIAQSEKVPLIVFRNALESRMREKGDVTGITGNESFLDHVHPSIEGHQLLAELIVDEMVGMGLLNRDRHLTVDEKTALYKKGMDALDPGVFVTRDLNLAKVLKWAGKKEEARQVLERAKTQLSDHPEVHKMLGAFLLEDGKYEKAIAEYTKAVELSGNDPQLEFSLATAYYKAGFRAESRRIYEKLLERDRDIPEAYANLAMIHLEAGRVGEALTILQRGLSKSPEAAPLFAPYALARAMSGSPEKAIPWMVRAVEAEPGDPSHLYNLAGMYALTGRDQDAFRSLERAVDRGYGKADKLAHDPVFASIRERPEFTRILDRLK